MIARKMVSSKVLSIFAVLCSFPAAARADQTCLSSGQLAGIVFGCIFGTLVIGFAVLFGLWYLRRRSIEKARVMRDKLCDCTPVMCEGQRCFTERKSEKYGLEPTKKRKDVENYAYDNLQFAADDQISKAIQTKPEHGQTQNGDLVKAILRGKLRKNILLGRLSAMDAQSTESLAEVHEIVTVHLRSKDFTGLGLTIQGNMRDGIFVKDLMQLGPAKECGKISTGDRVLSLTVSFEKMAYEDALTILSYASPYEVKLKLQKTDIYRSLSSQRLSQAFGPERMTQRHPLFKSQSTDDFHLFYEMQRPASPKDSRRSKSLSVAPGPLEKQGSLDRRVPIKESLALQPIAEKHDELPSPTSSVAEGKRGDVESQRSSKCSSSSSLAQSRTEELKTQIVVQAEIEHHEQQNREKVEEVSVDAEFKKTPDHDLVVVGVEEPEILKETVSKTIKAASVVPFRKKATKAPEPPSASQSSEGTSDPFAELSYEDKMQILRLSYEDSDITRSTPNLSQIVPPPSIIEEECSPTQQATVHTGEVYIKARQDSVSSDSSGDYDLEAARQRLRERSLLVTSEPDNAPEMLPVQLLVKSKAPPPLSPPPPLPKLNLDFESWETNTQDNKVTISIDDAVSPGEKLKTERERMFMSGDRLWDATREEDERKVYVERTEIRVSPPRSPPREHRSASVDALREREREANNNNMLDIRLKETSINRSFDYADEIDARELYRAKRANLRASVPDSNWFRLYDQNGGPQQRDDTIHFVSSDIDSSRNSTKPYKPVAKRDSGYGTLGDRDENTGMRMNGDHYHKLLYFQQQIAKQQEELAKIGLTVPSQAAALAAYSHGSHS